MQVTYFDFLTALARISTLFKANDPTDQQSEVDKRIAANKRQWELSSGQGYDVARKDQRRTKKIAPIFGLLYAAVLVFLICMAAYGVYWWLSFDWYEYAQSQPSGVSLIHLNQEGFTPVANGG